MMNVTTHDIEANGTKYILEWTHSEDGKGHIAITETCSNPEGEEDDPNDCGDDFHETYDFEEVA